MRTHREPELDVAVLGGGLAGLSLALQLKGRRPSTKIAVLEKNTRPAPEGTFKIGESVVEVGSWYLREVLGLGDHLAQHQLPKFGLRYFMSADGNRDIARRLEFGLLRVARLGLTLPFRGLPFTTYNFDRGRLENALAERAQAAGVTLHEGASITGVELDPRGHTITLEQGGEARALRARWVVDASGRRSLIKRQLGLAEAVDHAVDARWMRVGAPIDVEQWSRSPAFLERTLPGLRRLSTNHLVGPGYWVWLIPLPQGATSVGLVVDEQVHSLREVRTPAQLLAWLRPREPQCADALAAHEGAIWDFRRMRGGAYGCRRLFSRDRWAITGEAGLYADPLYSPGTDFIAVANTLITEILSRELSGESFAGELQFAETLMKRLFEQYLMLYRGQYSVLRSPRAMVQKVIWDTAAYFSFNALLFHSGKLTDRRFLASARAEVEEIGRLQWRTQAILRERAEREPGEVRDACVDQSGVPFLHALYMTSGPRESEEALLAKLRENLAVLRAFSARLAGERGKGAAIDLGPELEPLCP